MLIISPRVDTFTADTTSSHAHGREAASVPALRLPKRTSRQSTQPRTASAQKGESLLRHLQPARHADNPLVVGLLEGHHRRRPNTESGILAVLKSGRDQLAKTPPKNEEKSNGPKRPAKKEIWDSPVLYTSSFCQYCDLDILEFTGRLVQVLNLADKLKRIAIK